MPDFPQSELLNWYDSHKRDLPWRRTGDPYHIWVSEIMLQQTRVDTVIPYYLRFTKAFPTVIDLARAERQQVLKLWEGLGYYSRARNLHDAAKTVVEFFDGRLPDTPETIRSLKGIGPYTSAALLSIAFNKPHAVVDGNVIRVLSRYYGIEEDVRDPATKRQIWKLAEEILDRSRPGDYNQALMEAGATLCSPARPQCGSCPLSLGCVAFKTASTSRLPYKSPARKVPHHTIGVGLITDRSGRLLISLRPEDVMLGGLWEFPGGKVKENETIHEAVAREMKEELDVKVDIFHEFMEVKHAYSHFRITMHACWCRIRPGQKEPEPRSSRELKWVSLDELDHYPFPKANKMLIDELKRQGLEI